MQTTPSASPVQPPHRPPTMKQSSAVFCQVVIVLIGMGALGFLLWEPHLEGRNARATTFEIYFKDPFLAYVYLGSTPFFVALHRAFRLFEHVRRSGAFSRATLAALRTIKHCALAIIGFVVGAAVLILLFGDGEDRPAGMFMCLLVIGASGAAATVATLFARKLQAALGLHATQAGDAR